MLIYVNKFKTKTILTTCEFYKIIV